jgi:hypothetical protein
MGLHRKFPASGNSGILLPNREKFSSDQGKCWPKAAFAGKEQGIDGGSGHREFIVKR